tara:strand:- start:647 stop:781 length:135 start_codon:yes stop_codon:yes gene_type:complete
MLLVIDMHIVQTPVARRAWAAAAAHGRIGRLRALHSKQAQIFVL